MNIDEGGEVFNIEQLLLGSEYKPMLLIHVNGQPIQMLCDTGACKTVLRQPPKNLQYSKDTLVVKSATGHTTVQQLTAPLELMHTESGRRCFIKCIYDPSCPVNLLGRDALTELKIGVVPEENGMIAECMLNDNTPEPDSINTAHSSNVCLSQGYGVPHYYWTLELPELTKLHNVARKYTPPTSYFQKPTDYHNTLRFKQTPGPDPLYDQQVWKLGQQSLTLQHLYVTKSGNAVCSVIQSAAVKALNRMPKPHVSVAHDYHSDWKDLGNVLARVEADTYEKTEDTHEGWLQGRRTGCFRYTLGWLVAVRPAVHLADAAETHAQLTE